MKRFKNPRMWVLVTFLLSGACLLYGWTLLEQRAEQYHYYSLGRTAYITTRYDEAVEYFDRSYSRYQDDVRDGTSMFAVPPSLELAALTQHFKALSLVKSGNSKMAAFAFREALKLTNEEALSRLRLTQAELAKLQADRKVTQIDYEILLMQKPQLTKPEDGEDGEMKSDNGGNTSGKTDRDKL